MSVRKTFFNLISTVLAASALAFVLVACGGSGTTSSPSTAKEVAGTASVPNSADKNLVASTAFGTEALTAANFSARVPDASLSLISISDSDAAKVVLMGMVEPTSNTVTLDPANCATTLVFLGLGGSDLTADERVALWASVKAHSTTSDLATAIGTAMATDLYALENGNADIKTALNSALTAQVGSLPAQKEDGPTPKDESQAPQFSIVEAKDNGSHHGTVEGRQTDGFVIDNVLSPLEGTCFVYKTGYMAKDLTVHESGLTKVGAANPFAAGASSPVIPLTLDSAFAAEFYDIVVLQPVFDRPASEVFSLPAYAGEVAALRASLATMYRRGLMKVTAAQMFDAFGAPQVDMTKDSLDQSVTAFSAINGESGATMVSADEGNGLGSLVSRCASVPANSEADAFSTLAALAPLLQAQAPDLAQTLATKSLTSEQIQAFRGTMKILSLMGSWEYSATAGRFAKSFTKGSAANRTRGSFGFSKIEVDPPSGDFEVHTTFLIKTKVNTQLFPNPITYEFSLSEEPGTITNAVMNDGQGKVGRTITTTSPNCYLVTGTDSVGIALLDVTVTTKDSEGNDVSFTEQRRYTPKGHAEFSVFTAEPSLQGPDWYDMCSGVRIPKANPVNGVYAPVKLELFAEVTGDNIYWRHGRKDSEWNFPAFSGPVHPSSKSWNFVGQTDRTSSSGNSTMTFAAFDYGDHILVVNLSGAGKKDDDAYRQWLFSFCTSWGQAVQARYRLTPQ